MLWQPIAPQVIRRAYKAETSGASLSWIVASSRLGRIEDVVAEGMLLALLASPQLRNSQLLRHLGCRRSPISSTHVIYKVPLVRIPLFSYPCILLLFYSFTTPNPSAHSPTLGRTRSRRHVSSHGLTERHCNRAIETKWQYCNRLE